MIRRPAVLAAGLALALTATAMILGASAAPGVRDAGICIPVIYCPRPAPKPAPTEPTPGAPMAPTDPAPPAVPGMPGVPGGPADHADLLDPAVPADPSATPTPADPVPAPADPGAPVFTATPASMGSESLSFRGLSGISIVSVPTADGGSIRVLKISADAITIEGFSLTVRPPGGPGLVTEADTMSLRGHVTVYVGSVTGSSMGGAPLTIGTDTPPPLTDVEPGLLDVTMGLVGALADSIVYTNTDQRIVAGT
ncbi:hypothetical protein [Microbacterium sp. XT11]|uniref:hypothetical protein n=1 Tax=Microbacterium sp. XT11 TaxID=367477 RepID=UPI000835838F|nr:hypothetical protein [Microbacterium sp. XT11]